MKKGIVDYENWLRNTGVAKSTVTTYLSRVNLFLLAIGKTELSTEVVKEYLLTIDHLKSQTKHLSLVAIKSYAKYCGVDIDIQSTHRAEYLNRKMPTNTEMRKMWRILSQRQDFFRQRDRAIISVLYHAGIRIDEARCLNLSDLDLSNRKMLVRDLKGKKERWVPLNTLLLNDLIEYIVVRQGLPTTTARLFVTNGKGHRYDEIVYGSFRQIIKSVLKQAGVGHLCPYSFRHAFATNLYRLGLAPELIGDLLGHSSKSYGCLPFYIVPAELTAEQALEEIAKLATA